jgi:hypothetical protein
MNADIRTYLDFDGHSTWRRHYDQIRNAGVVHLVFTPAFAEAFLPRESSTELIIELLDTTDGNTYRHKMYAAYDDAGYNSILDQDWNCIDGLIGLQGYFYAEHYCPCHRKDYASDAGAIIENDECEGRRFLVRSITCEKLPDLILYSETMSEDELEALLNGS